MKRLGSTKATVLNYCFNFILTVNINLININNNNIIIYRLYLIYYSSQPNIISNIMQGLQ
jgi:hypothetical protein